MVRRMPIMSAADRILASLETKRLRRTWNPDLHPRDSKGRFVETGGIARMWGGGMARVLRALGGRDVLVENLATHERSRINAARLTMVARPDGSAPTKSKQKVRDEDERRFGDENRGNGFAAHDPAKDDNGEDHGENDPGDNGFTPDEPHTHDDEGKPIGQDIEGQDHGAGPDDPNQDDDPLLVPQGRVMANPKDENGDRVGNATQRGNAPQRSFPDLLSITGGGADHRGAAIHNQHVMGNGDALRAAGPKVNDHNSQFWDTSHARRALRDLSVDYFGDLEGVWPEDWNNAEARDLYEELFGWLSGDEAPFEVGDDKNDHFDPTEVDKLSWSADDAEHLAELAHNDGQDDVARYAQNLADALNFAYERFDSHGKKPIPAPKRKLANDQPLVPRAWRPDGTRETVYKTPGQQPGTTGSRSKSAAGKGQRRFNTLADVHQHWQSGTLVPVTSDKAKQERHRKETAALFDKLEKPQLSRGGTFVVAKMTVEKDGKRKSGYAVIVSNSGVRLAMSDRKGEALDFANRLEAAQSDGKPFDWDAPDFHKRLESTEGQAMVRQASEEAKKAFADKAAKKREGAAAKRTPAPATPAPAAPPAPAPAERPNPLVQAAQNIANTTGAPAQNIGVGHVGPGTNTAPDGRTRKPSTTGELREYWKNGGDPSFDAHTKERLSQFANNRDLKITLADHFAFAVIERGPENFNVVRAYDGRGIGFTGSAGQGFKSRQDASRFALMIGREVEEPSRPGQPVDWWDPELFRRNPNRIGGWRKEFGNRMDDVRGRFDIEHGHADSYFAKEYEKRQEEQNKPAPTPAATPAAAPAAAAPNAPQATPDGDFPNTGDEVNSPDGVGSVMAVNKDSGSVLVRAEQGTHSHALKDITRPDGTPYAGNRANTPNPDAPQPAPQAAPEQRDWSQVSREDLDAAYAKADQDWSDTLSSGDQAKKARAQAEKTAILAEAQRRDGQAYAQQLSRVQLGARNDSGHRPAAVDGDNQDDATLQGSAGRWTWNRLGHGTRYSSKKPFLTEEAALADLVREHDSERPPAPPAASDVPTEPQDDAPGEQRPTLAVTAASHHIVEALDLAEQQLGPVVNSLTELRGAPAALDLAAPAGDAVDALKRGDIEPSEAIRRFQDALDGMQRALRGRGGDHAHAAEFLRLARENVSVARQALSEQHKRSNDSVVRGSRSDVLEDVPGQGSGSVPDGQGVRGVRPGAVGRDRAADRGSDGGVGSSAAGGDGRGGAGSRAEVGPDAGPGAGASGHGVRDAEGSGDGDEGHAAGGAASAPVAFGTPEQQATAPAYEPPADGKTLVPSSPVNRAKANIAAIEILRRLQDENRPATGAEQQELARYSGWGAVPQIFKPQPDAQFQPLAKRLRSLLSDAEWDDARANTLNAHYTDPQIVQQMWSALTDLGFDAGSVLEPGSGVGNFIGYAPDGTHMTGVEVDSITAGIAKALYPHAEVRHESFGDTRAPNGTFDAAVGNVPFGRYKVPDLVHNKGGHSIHNHFILKSLDLTRGGGLVSVVTSALTMDGHGGRSEAARMEMAEKAELVGAIRLPSGAHQRTAGTSVMTDLLIFRRRDKSKSFTSGRNRKGEVKRPSERTQNDPPMWVHSLPTYALPGQNPPKADTPPEQAEPPVFYNSYFHDNPQQVLGRLAVGHGMNRDNELRVDGDGKTIANLQRVLKRTVEEAKAAGLAYKPDTEGRSRVTLLPPGSSRVDGHVQAEPDGTFTQVRDGMVHPFPVFKTQANEARQLLAIRDTFQSLLSEENRKDADESLIERLREALNKQYDAYHSKFGAINRFTWSKRTAVDPDTGEKVEKTYRKKAARGGLFTNDPTMANITPLDEYDDTTGKTTKAPIFSKRLGTYREIAKYADDPQDALAIVLETDGRLTADGLARVMRTDADTAIARLLTARSVDPDTGVEYPMAFQAPDGKLVTAADYLSGNVRQKLDEARHAAADDSRYDLNVEHLERVVPPDLSTGEIAAPMGASWIGREPVEQFLRETFNDQRIKVSWQGGALWAVDAPDGAKKSIAERTAHTWSAKGYTALEIAEAILTNRKIVVTKKDGHGENAKSVYDKDATEDAQAKASLLREAFTDWLWADSDRAEKHKRYYNDNFNSMAPRSYDGQRRTIPGLVEWFDPHPHQHAAVARMVNEPSVLLAHEVGAGKTAEMAMGVMELRRLGLVKKAAMVVPGHMLEQFRHEFAEIFPESVANNRILTASSEDLAGKGRREFIARAAAGDYDAIILTQTAFESIQMRPEVQEDYISRRVERLREKIFRQKDADGEGNDTRLVKRMEASLKSLEEKLDKKLSGLKDAAGLHFEDMGVDYLVVDEAHMYKNLDTPSSVAAIDGSNRASDLEMKLEWLRERSSTGRVVTFATATPVANSIAEVHTMMRYLRPDLLKELGMLDFDDFASTFAQMVSAVERSPDGSYKEKTRLAAFQNVPELLRLWRSFADVKTAEDLDLPVPGIVGGKAVTITMPMSPAQEEYEARLRIRAARLEGGNVDPKEDNHLKLLGDGRMAALDPRLLDPSLGGGNKLPTVADNVVRIYGETKDAVFPTSKTDATPHETPGGLQIVFLDLGTPKDPGRSKKRKKKAGSGSEADEMDAGLADDGSELSREDEETYTDFSTYDELKSLLIARGIPSEQIRFIHEAKDDAAKARLFNDARSGKISVLLGSTAKMGTGTNVQLRAVALHHVDAPWRPADVDQRNGRVIRQGNANAEVAIFQYATERSTDAKFWEAIARKAKFIRALMRGSLSERVVEDIGPVTFDADEVSALTAGDPHLIAQAQLKPLVNRLRGRFNAYRRSQEGFKQAIRDSAQAEEWTKQYVAQLQKAVEKRKTTRGDDFNARIGTTDFEGGDARDDARRALNTALRAVFADGMRRPYDENAPATRIGQVGGLDVTARFVRTRSIGNQWYDTVRVDLPQVPGAWQDYEDHELIDHDGKPRSLPLSRIENSIANIDERINRAEHRRADKKRAAEQAAGRIGKPFELATEFDESTRQLDLLNEIMRLKAQPTVTEEDTAKRNKQIDSLDAELRAMSSDQEDVLAQVAARDVNLVPKTPAPPAISQDDKGRVKWIWPTTEARDAERAKKLAAKREAFLARTSSSAQAAPAQPDALGMNNADLKEETDQLAERISKGEATDADVVRHAGLEREQQRRAKNRQAKEKPATPTGQGDESASSNPSASDDTTTPPQQAPAEPNLTTAQAAALESALNSVRSPDGRQIEAHPNVLRRLLKLGYAEERSKPRVGGGSITYYVLTPEGERRAKSIGEEREKARAARLAELDAADEAPEGESQTDTTPSPSQDSPEPVQRPAAPANGIPGASPQQPPAPRTTPPQEDRPRPARNQADTVRPFANAREWSAGMATVEAAQGQVTRAAETTWGRDVPGTARSLRDNVFAAIAAQEAGDFDDAAGSLVAAQDDAQALRSSLDDVDRPGMEDPLSNFMRTADDYLARHAVSVEKRRREDAQQGSIEREAQEQFRRSLMGDQASASEAPEAPAAGSVAPSTAAGWRDGDFQPGDTVHFRNPNAMNALQKGEFVRSTGPGAALLRNPQGAEREVQYIDVVGRTRNGEFQQNPQSPTPQANRQDQQPTPPTPEPAAAPAASTGGTAPQAPRPQRTAPSDVRPVPATPPADMSADQLGEELDSLDERIESLKGATDPVDLAYRFRLEQRQFELDEEERRRWKPTVEHDENGKAIPRKRGDVIRDRLAGYGLNDAETRGLAHRVEDLPAAKPGGYSDDEWARIDAEASANESYPPTEEQGIIIEGAARRGLNMAVMALAGTGKSSTLKMLSHRMPGKRIVYLAFNRSVANEAREAQARGEYAQNLTASTANSYAAKVADKRLNNRLPSNKRDGFKKLSAQQIADRMRWYDTVKAGNRDLSPGGAATVAERMIRTWAKSADAEMGPQHITGAKTKQEARDLFNAVKPLADRMWANLSDPTRGDADEDLTMDFDYIVKMWALGGYKIDADTLFWDEAQDVNPVMEGVVRGAIDQGVQVVAVGDSNQAIYGFRGAADALGKLPVDARATLTQSFRFGPAVADVGNRFLRLLGTRMRLKGFDRKKSRLGNIKPGDETMVIARTNAGVALAAVEALAAGRRVAVSGGVKDLQEFVQAARALANGEHTDHAELARFNGMAYDDILDAVKDDPDLSQLKSLFQLLEKHPDEIDQLMESGAQSARSENVGGRVWVTLDWNDPKAGQLKRWLGDAKTNGVGKLLYDPATRRYYYEPGKRNVPWKDARTGRSGEHRVDNKLSLEDAQKKIDAHLAKLYPQEEAEGGRLVPETQEHDVLVTTAHKSKGLESERVRVADDFRGPERDDNGNIKWDTMPDDEALRVAYVSVTRATDVLDSGSLGWVFEAVNDEDPTQPPTGEYRRDWVPDDFKTGDRINFQGEDGTFHTGEVARVDAPGLIARYEDDGQRREQDISVAQVQRLNGQKQPLLPVASDGELNQAIAEGRYPSAGGDAPVKLDPEQVRNDLADLRGDAIAPETGDANAPQAPAAADTPQPADTEPTPTAPEADNAPAAGTGAWAEGDEVITPQDEQGTIQHVADNGVALVATDIGLRPVALSELKRPGQDMSEAEAVRQAETRGRRAEEDAWLAAAATSEGAPIKTMDGYRLANLDVDAGHGAIMRDGEMVAWIRARGPKGEATWLAQDARGGRPMTPAAAVSEGDGEDGIYHSIERAAWSAAYGADSSVDPSRGQGVTRPEDQRGPIMGTLLTEAQFREFQDLAKRWESSDDADLRHVGTKYYAGPVSAGQMRHAADAVDSEADALDLSTADGRRREKLYRGLAKGLRSQARSLEASATMAPPGEHDPFSRRGMQPDAPESGDGARGDADVPEWADDLGNGIWVDKPKKGVSGPRNIYVDGRIEGLLGRDKDTDEYYWWRPGGQRGEGRYDTPEEAARGFARDMQDRDLPSLSNREGDAEAGPSDSADGSSEGDNSTPNDDVSDGGQGQEERDQTDERDDSEDNNDDRDGRRRRRNRLGNGAGGAGGPGLPGVPHLSGPGDGNRGTAPGAGGSGGNDRNGGGRAPHASGADTNSGPDENGGRFLSLPELAEHWSQVERLVTPEGEKLLFGPDPKARTAELAGQTTQVRIDEVHVPHTWYKGRYIGNIRANGQKLKEWEAQLPFPGAGVHDTPRFSSRNAALAYLVLASEAHDNYRDVSRISPEQAREFRFMSVDDHREEDQAALAAYSPEGKERLAALKQLMDSLHNGQSPSDNVADDLANAFTGAQWLYENFPRPDTTEGVTGLRSSLGRVMERSSFALDTISPEHPLAHNHARQRDEDAAAYMHGQLAKVKKEDAETVAPEGLRNGDLVEISGLADVSFGPERRKEQGYIVGEPIKTTIDIGRKGGPVSGWRITVSDTPFIPPGRLAKRRTFLIPDKNKGITRFARAEDTGLPTDEIIRVGRPGQPEGTPDAGRAVPTGDAPASAAASQYGINSAHPLGERRAGTVDGRRIPTPEEMEQYEVGEDRAIDDEGERALFGSPERMQELAAQGFVPEPRIRSDKDGEVWRNGRLIGNLREPNRHGFYTEEPPQLWEGELPLATYLHEPRFTTRDQAIAYLVLRDMEQGEPDLSIVHPDIAWDFSHTNPGLGFPPEEEGLRGLESLNDSPAAMERYRKIRALVDALGRGETVSGNVADDLDHLHDELRWLDSTHYKHQPADLKHKYILGPGWLADQIREYLDVLRPEDPRAMHHETSKARAAKQFLSTLLDEGGRDNSRKVPVTDLRAGDIVHLAGRVTDRYPGATDSRTGYVVGEPSKATFTVNKKRHKGLRITVADSPVGAHKLDGNTFIIPVGDSVERLASVDDITLPVDEHTYGRQVGETPVATPERTAGTPSGEARTTAQNAEEPRPDSDTRTNAPAADAQRSTPETGSSAADRPAPAARPEPETAQQAAADQAEPEAPAEPEPVGGRPAEWVKVSDIAMGDLVRIDGITKRGTSRTLAGYVVGGPELVPTEQARKVQDMYRVLIADTPDGKGARGSVWVAQDATAARATGDASDTGSLQTGADSDVLTGRISGRVANDADGNGLFPGSTVTDDDGREGVVVGATAGTAQVQFGDDRTDDAHAPSSLTVTDGGAARPTGWTPDGHRVDTGNVVGDRDGNMLGTVEEVDGDTATVATPQGMEPMSIRDLRVLGGSDSSGPADEKVAHVEPVTAGEIQPGDVLVRGNRTVKVKTAQHSGQTSYLGLEDTTSGDTNTLAVPSDTEMQRAAAADGGAPDLGPEDAPLANDPITTHEPAPAVDPVTGPTVDPELAPEERDAIADRGTAPSSDPDAEQAAARIGRDLPVTPDQASALADDLREGADTSTPEGRAAKRAADHLDQAAGQAGAADDGGMTTEARYLQTGDVIEAPVNGETSRLLVVEANRSEDGNTVDLQLANADGRFIHQTVGARVPFRPVPHDGNDVGGGVSEQSDRRIVPATGLKPGDHLVFGPGTNGSDWFTRKVQSVDVSDGRVSVQLEGLAGGPSSTRHFQILGGRGGAAELTTVMDKERPAAAWFASNQARLTGEAPNTPAPDSAPSGRPEPGTVGSVGVGDTIALPDETNPDTMGAYRVVDVADAPGGIRILTVEDGDGQRSERTLTATDPLYQLPEPEAPAAGPDTEARDPNQGLDPEAFQADYADAVARAVIGNAIQGTSTPGSIHQLREQIAEQLTLQAMRSLMRKLRQDFVNVVDGTGITGDARERMLAELRKTAMQTRTDAVKAAVRTLDDLEPLDGESPEDMARRAADLLRLIPESLRNRPKPEPDSAVPDDVPGDGGAASRIDDEVSSHVGDAVGDALAAADDGPLTPERRAAIVARLAQRMADSRNDTAGRIAANLPEGQRPGLMAGIVAALMQIARRIVELVAAFLKALAAGVKATGRAIARFGKGLGRRIRSWPETRRLRRMASAARSLPRPGDGMSLAEKVAHWAQLLPAPGRFGQVARRSRWYRSAARTTLAAGQLPQVQDGVRWTMDRAADRGPGRQALRHLAALRAAGADVDADLIARLTAAAPELGDDPHGTVRHARRYADRTEARLRDLRAVAAGTNAPDLAPEIAAARLEAQHAQQEAERLQQAYTAALPSAVRDTLSQVREMGPGGRNRLTLSHSSDAAATRALTDAAQYVPREWLADRASRFMTAVSGDAGAYDADSGTATIADLGDGGRATAAHALLAHLQRNYPDLLAAQEAFGFTRTHTGRPGARRSTLDVLLARLFGGQADQVTDEQIAARGLATMFSGDWYRDDDLRAFLLGLLATR
jgi:N12 class adenine-specific DNA methylase/superfamily I DNA/RNA helicase